jgi:hypothetical protein
MEKHSRKYDHAQPTKDEILEKAKERVRKNEHD